MLDMRGGRLADGLGIAPRGRSEEDLHAYGTSVHVAQTDGSEGNKIIFDMYVSMRSMNGARRTKLKMEQQKVGPKSNGDEMCQR